MGCCGLDDPTKQKPFLPQAIGFTLFMSLFLAGFLTSLLVAVFSRRGRAALAAFVAFLRTSLNELKSGKSEKLNVNRCKISGRIVNYSPRLAGLVYRHFLAICVAFFAIFAIVFTALGIWVGVALGAVLGVCAVALLAKTQRLLISGKHHG